MSCQWHRSLAAVRGFSLFQLLLLVTSSASDGQTEKPVLHGRHWMAITGKRPRATLTPTLALKEGKPLLAFSVQGADTQDQNLLQFFLNVVEFGMNVQEACEAPNIVSYQIRRISKIPVVFSLQN